MINEKALHILEFDKVRSRLASLTACSLGRELAEKLQPQVEAEFVARSLEETAAVAFLAEQGERLPLGGIHDVRQAAGRAALGAILELEELRNIAATMKSARILGSFLLNRLEETPILSEYAEGFVSLQRLEQAVEAVIDEHGQMRDDATPELAKLRRAIRTAHGRVKERLQSVLRSQEYQKYFQEALVTMRGDRYVIPVKQEYKHFFPGIVHDQSASGATVFIEPMSIVELNNEIKQCVAAERNEIERILQSLSAVTGRDNDSIQENCRLLGQMDLLAAKVRLAEQWKCTKPVFNEAKRLSLRQARHPLINAAQVVPIDLFLGEEYTMLLITGPNTGGKTVALKTLGLMVLMAQAGLFLPVDSGSSICMFSQVFADIGDEQSIEQSLSTFSSHMTHLVSILQEVGADDLVLLDEIGAGTDPVEGAALAMSILENLQACGALTVATTHYSELKQFAYAREGVENASVEFDVQTLRPTYRLRIGMAGSSNAFAISRRLGLAEAILDRARVLMDQQHVDLAAMMQELEKEKLEYQERLATLELQQRSWEQEQRRWEAKRSQEEEKAALRLEQSKTKAAELLRQARKTAEESVNLIKKQAQEQDQQRRQNAFQQARERLQGALDGTRPQFRKIVAGSPVEQELLREGLAVMVKTLGQKGRILSWNTKEATVQIGALKMNVPLKACLLVEDGKVEEPPVKAAPRISAAFLSKRLDVPREIDVRGQNIEEAVEILAKFLDDAMLAGHTKINVIHGKGTGALRKGVRAYLKQHHGVRDISIGEVTEGGDGATLVQLK